MTDRPLRIGMVCYPTYGGSGAVAADLGGRLARDGHVVHFISHARPFRIARDFHPNIHHHLVETLEYPLFPGALYGISASVAIHRVAMEAKLDILHVHYALPHAVCAFLAMEMLPPERRMPVLTTLHGTDITLIGDMPSFKPSVKLGLDKSQGLTCVSKWLADRTCEKFDICERLEVIHNFVDPDEFHPGGGGCPRSAFARPGESVLVHVSNFRPVKRIPDVIRTFAGVRAERPARLLLVGDGPELEPAMRLAESLGVAHAIHPLGVQPDVNQFMSMADLLLFPSDGESFGLAAAEAMACEVPVIGSRAGGLPELVIDGEHGHLCEVGDHAGMARRSLELLADDDRRRAMGAAGRRRILERFTPERIVPLYERTYRWLIERGPGA